jgi:putative glutamine amidotransferase
MTPPLVVVTAIPRRIPTSLPGKSDHLTVHRRFGQLIRAAGGIPIGVGADADPVALAERVDAIVLSGGGDVDPVLYGADQHAKTVWVERDRDDFELALVRAARERDVPMLAVCRGIQLLNVALAGTLVQHLPDVTELDHDVREPHDEPAHAVELEPGSLVGKTYRRERLAVNSVHHQAVDRLGDGLRATAFATDGTIEAIEADDGRAWGIQWHPELMHPRYDTEQISAFETLARLAGGRA